MGKVLVETVSKQRFSGGVPFLLFGNWGDAAIIIKMKYLCMYLFMKLCKLLFEHTQGSVALLSERLLWPDCEQMSCLSSWN